MLWPQVSDEVCMRYSAVRYKNADQVGQPSRRRCAFSRCPLDTGQFYVATPCREARSPPPDVLWPATAWSCSAPPALQIAHRAHIKALRLTC